MLKNEYNTNTNVLFRLTSTEFLTSLHWVCNSSLIFLEFSKRSVRYIDIVLSHLDQMFISDSKNDLARNQISMFDKNVFSLIKVHLL